MNVAEETLDFLKELVAVVKEQKARIEILEVKFSILTEAHIAEVEALHARISNLTLLVK